MKITPTIGRVVWYYDDAQQKLSNAQAFDAHICYVHGDGALVNLLVVDYNGNTFPRTSVPLIQENDPIPSLGYFCEWMPYQVGQAKKRVEESKPT